MKLPVSYHQQRMWFIDHFERDYLYEGGPVYHNIPLSLTLKKEVTTNEIYQAFAQLINRHDILRTTIIKEGDQIFQSIKTPEEINIENLLTEQSDLKENQETLRKGFFNFENELLVKAFFERLENQTRILFVFHHAIVDRYSLGILKEDFLSFIAHPKDSLGFTMQYKDFSEWEQAVDPYETETLVAHWRKRLSNLQVLYIPTDTERVPVHIYKAATTAFSFSKDRLQSFAAINGTTSQIVTLAVYKMALAKFSGLSEIVIGTLMDMRNHLTASTVGAIENLVVLQSVLEENTTLAEACTVVANTWNTADLNKGIPFDKLVVEINPKKDMSRTALFDVLYLYDQHNAVTEDQDEPFEYKNQGLGKYDLNLLVQEKETTFDFILTYNDLYFQPGTIAAFLESMENILETAAVHQEELRGIALF
ncbi:condensation domain-containing protein [Flavobacterium sp. N502536]|uniref:condensation domain-containing protein n=1 Tax=Flavobacterium sp. N502536 TaxID=2986837 RepID=UPI002221BBA1|nr:condensation domain-containing protein [Flavobacterium sp. N502536]